MGKEFSNQYSCTMLARGYCLAHNGGWAMHNSNKNEQKLMLLCWENKKPR